MRRFLLILLASLLFAPAVQATLITVHTTPNFELETTNVYSQAYQYPSAADALAAANTFLFSDGAADHGWGVGAFGGDVSFQAQYFFFAYASNPGETIVVKMASYGDHFAGDRYGVLSQANATWIYDNHANDQYLLLKNEYVSAPIPEPTTAMMLAIGLAGLSMRQRHAPQKR